MDAWRAFKDSRPFIQNTTDEIDVMPDEFLHRHALQLRKRPSEENEEEGLVPIITKMPRSCYALIVPTCMEATVTVTVARLPLGGA